MSEISSKEQPNATDSPFFPDPPPSFQDQGARPPALSDHGARAVADLRDRVARLRSRAPASSHHAGELPARSISLDSHFSIAGIRSSQRLDFRTLALPAPQDQRA